MLKHEQIMKAMLLRLEGGEVIDFDQAREQAVVVLTHQSVNTEYYNLLRASAVMYQTIQQQSDAIEAIINLAELVGADGIVAPLLQMQTGLYLAKRIALEGVEGVAKDLPQQRG
jgi:hypothetical protein